MGKRVKEVEQLVKQEVANKSLQRASKPHGRASKSGGTASKAGSSE
ncbi:hypothetical protein [Solibacillus sp. CAU 1738]